METIIHVGVHKTGTTWLQQCVFPKLKGVLYFYKDELVDYKPYDKILMSNEEWSRSMPDRENQLYPLCELKKQYPQAKIIIGIRNENTWFKSCYSQLIRAGSYLSWEQYQQKYKDCRTPIVFYYYCKMMWKDVYVYKFEELKSNPDKIIKEMCEFIGCEVPDQIENKKVNVSIKHLKLWRAINILMRGEWLRKHIESPWWILTWLHRRLKK